MKLDVIAATLVTSLISTSALALDVEFSDPAWDGESVPQGQQCQRFGGEAPATPALKVSGIPAGSDALILAYSDLDSEKMNHGGHGRMRYAPATLTSTQEVPSVPGHTFDIPEDFSIIEAQRSPGWDTAGAYMPPCSGGNGHVYEVTVKSVKGEEVTGEATLSLGRY